jgi:hypothetical protein
MSGVRQATSSNSGFVLHEALVSLILLAMIMGLFAATLTFGRRVSDAGNSREGILEVSAGANSIARWLSSAVPSREVGPGGEGQALFEGNGHRLSFVTLGDGETQPGGMLAVTIAFAAPERNRAGAIVFASSPVRPGTAPNASASENQALMGNINDAAFSYFGSLREDSPPAWHREWRGVSRLPTLVALRASVDLKGRVETLDLSFRIVSN